MAVIRDLRLIALDYRMPAIEAYGMARALTAHRQASVIELETDDGVVGIGEAWGPPKVTAAYLDLLRGYYLGREIFDHEPIWHEIIARHYHMGVQNQLVACVSGINVAAWDAKGKTLGVPVCKLLGGKARQRVPVYASGGYITKDPENQLARQLERVAAEGYPAFKIKIGLGPDSDAERCKLAREIIGPQALLLVDVNGNYTAEMALASMRRIEACDVHVYEEPLAPQDYDGYRRLGAKAPIPVAAGEAHYTVFDFKRLIETGGVDVLQPDIALCGGLDQARAIWQLGALAGLRVSPHVWGSAVGLAAAVHYVASLPAYPHTDNVPYPALVEYDVGRNPLRDELLATPLRAEDGHIQVPDGPGLGIELDASVVERFRLA